MAEEPPTTEVNRKKSLNIDLPFVLVQQSIVLVLTGMILDGGSVFQVCFNAAVAFWGWVGMLRFSRIKALSKMDLRLFRYGYILVCVISFFVTRWIWQMRGYGNYL